MIERETPRHRLPRGPREEGPGPASSVLAWIVATLPIAGCLRPADPPLVIATAWPRSIRGDLESAYRRESGDRRPITWVGLGPGERLAGVLDRRGGVDLLLGGSSAEYGRLADSGRLAPLDRSDPAPWRSVRRPDPGRSRDLGDQSAGAADPRDDPSTLARAKAALGAEGWAEGYGRLVRRAARARPAVGRASAQASGLGESAAMAKLARSPGRARRFLAILEARGLVEPPSAASAIEAAADGLLADLLGAALVDAFEELRDADAALRRFGHPAKAEAAFGERPPWPPASVARLRASPTGSPLLETLAEQVAPDPDVRGWLLESWSGSGPGRRVDGSLLLELAGAVDGRLAREPRFRAWLRGEWAAWSRQLYRRVAQVAGGSVPR